MKKEIKTSGILRKRDDTGKMRKYELRRASIVAHMLSQNLHEKKVLDVGCGLGTCMDVLRRMGAHTTGLDIYNKGKYIKNFDLNSGEEFPFKSNSFDIVVCTETIEHTFYPNFILKEIKRVLKRDGIAIISLPHEYNLYNRLMILFGKQVSKEFLFDTYGHHYFATLDEIRDFVRKQFKIKEEYLQLFDDPVGSKLSVLKYLNKNLVTKSIFMKCVK